MDDFKVIDTIDAYQLGPGDLFKAEGIVYRAIQVTDEGTYIAVYVECLDDVFDDEEIALDPDQQIDILAYDYDGIEV